MTYATLADMIQQFGEREMRQLADRDNNGELDEAIVQTALERSSADIDGYIGWMHKQIVSAGQGARTLLRGLCCDMARYRLAGAGGVLVTDEMRDRHRDAISMLKMIAKGEVKLTAEDEPAPADQNRVQRLTVGSRIAEDLKDF